MHNVHKISRHQNNKTKYKLYTEDTIVGPTEKKKKEVAKHPNDYTR